MTQLTFDQFDEPSRRVLFFARQAVSDWGGKSIKPEHLLFGLITEHPEVVHPVLKPSVSMGRLVVELRDTASEAERVAESIDVPISETAESVLEKSIDEAGGPTGVVRPVHILLALLSKGDSAARILIKLSEPDSIRRLQSGGRDSRPGPQ